MSFRTRFAPMFILLAIGMSRLFTATPAQAEPLTDAAAFTKRLLKVAPAPSGLAELAAVLRKAKAFCNCRPGTPNVERRVGVLNTDLFDPNAPKATCIVPLFDDAGTLVGADVCNDWALMKN